MNRQRWGLGSALIRSTLAAALMVTLGQAALSRAGTTAEQPPLARPAALEPAAEKRTTLGLYLTAREAYERWKAAPEQVIVLDVRTPEEFLFVGHAEMAWNVPVVAQSYRWDAEKQKFPMLPLADFVARVRRIAASGDTLLVMCRSGGRGALAVDLLARAGFERVYNITDGMEGDVVEDPASVFRGQRLVNGWKNSGLPWTYQSDPTRMLLPAAGESAEQKR